MKATHSLNELMAWFQIQVVSIAENDLSVHALEIFLPESLHRGASPHRHENRRFNHTMLCVNSAGAGLSVLIFELKEIHQPSLSPPSEFFYHDAHALIEKFL
jgi:hypothetical protein